MTFKDYKKSGEEKALKNVTAQLNVILTATFLEVHLRLFELSLSLGRLHFNYTNTEYFLR